MADRVVGRLVHLHLRVHHDYECAVRTFAADAVVRVGRTHREGHRLGRGCQVAQRRGGDVARAARGDARHIVVVTCPGVAHATVRDRRREVHGCHLRVVADRVVGRLVHLDLRVHRDGECFGRAVASHTVISEVRCHRDGGSQRGVRCVRGREGRDVAITAGGQTNAGLIVRPRVGHISTSVRRGERHGCRGVVAHLLVFHSIHRGNRVDSDVLDLDGAIAFGIGHGPLSADHSRSEVAGWQRIEVHMCHCKICCRRAGVCQIGGLKRDGNRSVDVARCVSAKCKVRRSSKGRLDRVHNFH